MSKKPDEKCDVCQRKPNELWQCSHPECPCRKQITVGIPDVLHEDGLVPPLINDSH